MRKICIPDFEDANFAHIVGDGVSHFEFIFITLQDSLISPFINILMRFMLR